MSELMDDLNTKHVMEHRIEQARNCVHHCKHYWQPKDCMSFTLTLKPKLYTYQAITQYEMTHLELLKIISGIHTIWVAELTKTGNLHYHFIIHERNPVSVICLINRIRKNRLFGFYKAIPINSKDHLDKSLEYLLKDLSTTMKILFTNNYRPIIFDKQ